MFGAIFKLQVFQFIVPGFVNTLISHEGVNFELRIGSDGLHMNFLLWDLQVWMYSREGRRYSELPIFMARYSVFGCIITGDVTFGRIFSNDGRGRRWYN